MGYTTSFEGVFKLDKPLTVPQFNILKGLSDSENWRNDNTLPHSLCQWGPTDDGCGIEWDGSEKFYLYKEWLELVISKYLQPWGLMLNGQVRWQGEEIGDVGFLTVVDNVVSKEEYDLNKVAAQANFKGQVQAWFAQFRPRLTQDMVETMESLLST